MKLKSLILSIIFALFFITAQAATIVRLGPEYFPDPTRGRPISSGSLYIGLPDLDPEIVANQIQVTAVQESGVSVSLSQPISTSSGGVPLYNGSPVILTVDASYSLKLLDSYGSQVYYTPNSFAQDTSELLFLSNYSCGLAVAVADIGATPATLIVDCVTIISTGTTVIIPDTLLLDVLSGGSIDGIAGGATETLTFSGLNPSASRYQIFGDNVTVEGLTGGNLEWWQENTTPGTTDMSTAIRSLIASLPDDVQTIVPVIGGTYAIGSEVHIDRPVLFDCSGLGEETLLINTSGVLGVTFLWTGAGAGIMFTHSAQTSTLMTAGTTTGNYLVGGGITGACLNGNNLATTGAWVASTINAVWKVQARKFTGDGLIFDGGNGALSYKNIIDLNIVYGSTAPVYAMNGLKFRTFNSFTSTQNIVERVWGLVYNGNGVECGDTDNNIFNNIHVGTQAGGTGKAINFSNDGNSGRNNLVIYINGDAHAESATRGNRLLHINSEGTSVTKDVGATIHYDAIDYIDSKVFQTHRYKMTGTESIDANAMRPDGTNATSEITVGGQWSGIRFIDSADGYAQANIPIIDEWDDGDIDSITIFFTTESANTSAASRWRVRLDTATNLSGIGTPDIDEEFLASAADATNTMRQATFTFAAAVPFFEGDVILLRLDRLATDVTDTVVGNVVLFGVGITFTGDGPNSGGSGPFTP